ncbi:hypothetical protein OAM79_01705 [Litorivicinus sp.]|nr:hypothetical protein [Litorivicinus sp.]
MMKHRSHPLWKAFLLHRISGLSLALFLPIHFVILGLALEGASALNTALAFSDLPFVKAAEVGLILLLAIHLLGGIRILILELTHLSWDQQMLSRSAFGLSAIIATIFLWSAL